MYNLYVVLLKFFIHIIIKMDFALYWVVRKVRADIEGKLKRRKFKF